MPKDVAYTGMNKRRLLLGAAAASIVASGVKVFASPQPLKPLPDVKRLRALNHSRYPALSKNELGMLHYQYRKATAPAGDWSLWEPSVTFGEGPGVAGNELEGTQFDLYNSAHAVAHAVNKTPAYREFAETVLGAIADKGFDDRSWRYWTENRSGSGNNGLVLPYSPDPMLQSDAMYVGNMGATLSYYALMTDSRRFDKPHEFIYRGAGFEMDGTRVTTGQSWSYGWKDIVESFCKQIMQSNDRLVMCQIPTEYFMCNLSIAQTILAYDKVHGTDYADILYRKSGFFDVTGEEMFDPPRSTGKPPRTVIFGKRKIGDKWVAIPSYSPGDIYLTFGLYPLKPDWAMEIYPMARNQWYRDNSDGDGSWVFSFDGRPGNAAQDYYATVAGALAAAYARDAETRKKTLAYIERTAQPVWDGETLVYKFAYTKPEEYLRAGVFQARVLAAAAAAEGSPMGHFDLDRRRFKEPTLVDAPYPSVKVRRAMFDRDASALVISVTAERATTMRVTNLAPYSQAIVLRDNGAPQHLSVEPAGLRLETPAGEHDFIVGVQA